MTTPRKQFRVAMSETETYSIWIDAQSEAEAERLAEENWQQNGFTDWRFEDSDTSGIDVLDERELDQ